MLFHILDSTILLDYFEEEKKLLKLLLRLFNWMTLNFQGISSIQMSANDKTCIEWLFCHTNEFSSIQINETKCVNKRLVCFKELTRNEMIVPREYKC